MGVVALVVVFWYASIRVVVTDGWRTRVCVARVLVGLRVVVVSTYMRLINGYRGSGRVLLLVINNHLQAAMVHNKGTVIHGSSGFRTEDAHGVTPTSAFFAARCKHFMSGYCSWGQTCRFAHVKGVPTGSKTVPSETPCGHSGLVSGHSVTCTAQEEIDQQQQSSASLVISSGASRASNEQDGAMSMPQEDAEGVMSAAAKAAFGEEQSRHLTDGTTSAVFTARCKFFGNGYCSWGDQCRFAHVDPVPCCGNDSICETVVPREEEHVTPIQKRERPIARLWVHVYLHKPHDDFDLIPILLGTGGHHTRRIYEETHAKVRVRGRGSGHLEIDGKEEAPVPLMVAVTANGMKQKAFKVAVEMLVKRLDEVSEEFNEFCRQRRLPALEPLYSFGEIPQIAKRVLKAIKDKCNKKTPKQKVKLAPINEDESSSADVEPICASSVVSVRPRMQTDIDSCSIGVMPPNGAGVAFGSAVDYRETGKYSSGVMPGQTSEGICVDSAADEPTALSTPQSLWYVPRQQCGTRPAIADPRQHYSGDGSKHNSTCHYDEADDHGSVNPRELSSKVADMLMAGGVKVMDSRRIAETVHRLLEDYQTEEHHNASEQWRDDDSGWSVINVCGDPDAEDKSSEASFNTQMEASVMKFLWQEDKSI